MEVGVVNVVLTIESVVLRHCVIQEDVSDRMVKNLKGERNLSSIYKAWKIKKNLPDIQVFDFGEGLDKL